MADLIINHFLGADLPSDAKDKLAAECDIAIAREGNAKEKQFSFDSEDFTISVEIYEFLEQMVAKTSSLWHPTNDERFASYHDNLFEAAEDFRFKQIDIAKEILGGPVEILDEAIRRVKTRGPRKDCETTIQAESIPETTVSEPHPRDSLAPSVIPSAPPHTLDLLWASTSPIDPFLETVVEEALQGESPSRESVTTASLPARYVPPSNESVRDYLEKTVIGIVDRALNDAEMEKRHLHQVEEYLTMLDGAADRLEEVIPSNNLPPSSSGGALPNRALFSNYVTTEDIKSMFNIYDDLATMIISKDMVENPVEDLNDVFESLYAQKAQHQCNDEVGCGDSMMIDEPPTESSRPSVAETIRQSLDSQQELPETDYVHELAVNLLKSPKVHMNNIADIVAERGLKHPHIDDREESSCSIDLDCFTMGG